MYWGGIDVERSHLLTNLSSLLIKPVTGGATIVGPALTSQQRKDLGARIEATPWQWVGQELPQFSSAPTDFQPGGLSSGSVGMRLFTVAQRGGYAPMIGGLGYLLAPGTAAYSMKTVAAKDIWVRTPARVTAEKVPTSPPVELPVDDAEPDTRRQLAACAVRPVLDGSLRRARREHGAAARSSPASGTTSSATGRTWRAASACRCCWPRSAGSPEPTPAPTVTTHEMIATAPTTLWSLTADRHRPGSLAQSVERLGLSARAVRDQMSNDTWMVLAAVERAVLHRGRAAARIARRGRGVSGVGAQPDAGGNAGAVRVWPPSRWCRTSAGR